LQLSVAVEIADYDVELTVGTEADDAAIVIGSGRDGKI
jgi:hypothetical protein